jgi:hypothetical protein
MYSGVCYLVMCAIMCIVYKSVMYTEKICIYVYIYIYIYIYMCVFVYRKTEGQSRNRRGMWLKEYTGLPECCTTGEQIQVGMKPCAKTLT